MDLNKAQIYGRDTQRANSLLPRWYGEPGDWEDYANEMFDLHGDAYLLAVFPKPERFAHYRHWAKTGNW